MPGFETEEESFSDFHAGLLTLDSHIDIPWSFAPKASEKAAEDRGTGYIGYEKISPFIFSEERCVSLPKMRQGGLKAGCFAAYTAQRERTPEAADQTFRQALAMLTALKKMGNPAAENGTGGQLAKTVAGIRAAAAKNIPAVIPCVENGQIIGKDPSRLRILKEYGVRYITLTHNGHNELADSAVPLANRQDKEELHGGLSGLGREVVAEMNRLGILVDLSHVSEKTAFDVLRYSTVPPVISHASVKALCPHARNVSDELLAALKDKGGVIQITAVSGFLKKGGFLLKGEEEVSLDDFLDHIDCAVQKIGPEFVGISSDFDGGGGVKGFRDATDCPKVTQGLRKRGFSPSEIRALWGENFLRLLKRAEDEEDRAA